MIWAIVLQVFHTLRANKLRSFLTMFGICWGILSLILMTALGEGFRVAQQENLKELGLNIMIVWGGRTSIQSDSGQAGRRIRLEYSDYEAIRDRADAVLHVSPELIRSDLVSKTPINSGAFSVHGGIPIYQYMRSIRIRSGRLLNNEDEDHRRMVCILGSEVNDQLFRGTDSTHQTVKIGGHPFTVVGVMPYKDQNNSYSGQDRRSIFIPYHTMEKLFPDPSLGSTKGFIDNLIAMPRSMDVHEAAERQVRQILGVEHHFDAEDTDAVWIWNTARQSMMMDYLFRSMQWFLGAVALVTLGLGAIGVVNIMLISVRERTMEIGLRKSVGARRRDILIQFFSEAFVLTSFSGVLGLILGWGICRLINLLPIPEMVFRGMIITPEIGYIALGTLIVLGVGAGLYPAISASEMDPIEALHYEAN